jgi:hypothetical protein
MKLITLASLAISLLVLNYLFRKVLSGISIHSILVGYLRRYLPVIEMICWTAFTIWLINNFFADSRYILHLNTLILLCIFLFISWYVLRDYIAGVQVRSRFNFKAGQKIKSDQATGEIKRLGLLAMSVSTENGSNIIIPYSKLEQQSVELNFHEKGLAVSRFIIETDEGLNDSEVMEKLMETLMNSAWCSHKSKPEIQMLGVKDKKKQYEVSCSPTGKEGVEKLKALLIQSV